MPLICLSTCVTHCSYNLRLGIFMINLLKYMWNPLFLPFSSRSSSSKLLFLNLYSMSYTISILGDKLDFALKRFDIQYRYSWRVASSSTTPNCFLSFKSLHQHSATNSFTCLSTSHEAWKSTAIADCIMTLECLFLSEKRPDIVCSVYKEYY